MAYENIQIQFPNVCLGPQLGTYCTLNISNSDTFLLVKSFSGTIISQYLLSSNIVNELISLEYIGNCSWNTTFTGAIFFTLEKVSTSYCSLKKWEINNFSNMLDLKQEIIKSDTGIENYNINGMAVEHYNKTIVSFSQAGHTIISLNNTDKLSIGDSIIVGPSSYISNYGKVEQKIIAAIDGNTIYTTTPLLYSYVINDSLYSYKKVYLFSEYGLNKDKNKGTLFTIDSSSGNTLNSQTSTVFKNITAARWCPYYSNIAIINPNTNMLFIDPYSNFSNYTSMSLNNELSDKNNIFEVKDIIFNGDTLYKLANERILLDDMGNRQNINWTYYNLIPDTLNPYVYSISFYSNNFFGSDISVNSVNRTINLYIRVIDQFNVGLYNETITFSKISGDVGGTFTPSSSVATTDIDGYATITYTTNGTTNGFISLSANTNNGFSGLGSTKVFGFLLLPLYSSHSESCLLSEVSNSSKMYFTQTDYYKQSSNNIVIKSFFTTPGGDWYYKSPNNTELQSLLPWVVRNNQLDGPVYPFNGIENHIGIENSIFQLLDNSGSIKLTQVSGISSNNNIFQKNLFDSTTALSQMNLSQHYYISNGNYLDTITESLIIQQFVFIEEADPSLYSIKNPLNTNVWIRLRPYAFSLNPTTLKFEIREISFAGDTDYVDVTSQLIVSTFSAGSGAYGLNITYNPPFNFHNNAQVYIRITAYDTAPIPNNFYLLYWFYIIPDTISPYLINLSPNRSTINNEIDTDIYFEIVDDSTGVDISSLEVYINFRRVIPSNIIKVSNNNYQVIITSDTHFKHSSTVFVEVVVKDLAPTPNILYDTYKFYTGESEGVTYVVLSPKICEGGVDRQIDVQILVIDPGSGVDVESISLQIDNKSVDDVDKIIPIIYRI